jgi:hypothetical protein
MCWFCKLLIDNLVDVENFLLVKIKNEPSHLGLSVVFEKRYGPHEVHFLVLVSNVYLSQGPIVIFFI